MSAQYFHPGMVTTVRRVAYDFATHTGELHMPAGCCCDMTGCVRYFGRIGRGVKLIRCFAGDVHRYNYERTGKQWRYVPVEVPR